MDVGSLFSRGGFGMYTNLKFFTTLSFLVMVAVNALANILPINGVGTGEVSDFYPDLFAPAPLTFAIWGVIYLALGVYVVYQLGFLGKSKRLYQDPIWRRVALLFILSSLANSLWIFAWHHHFIGISLILMLIILACLTGIMETLRPISLWMKLPFSIYFGWITVATIANVTTWLVSIGWNGFGIPEATWTVLVLFVGLVISTLVMLSHKDAPYGLVIIWAYAGIGLKHASESGFDGTYPGILVTVAVSILALIAAQFYLKRQGKSRRRY